MTNRKLIRTTAFGAAGLTLAALLGAPAAAQSNDNSWTGPYVGGRLGYSFQADDGDETVLFDPTLSGNFNGTVTTSTGANAFSTGFCGGQSSDSATRPANGCREDDGGTDWAVHAGYDYHFGAIVVGLVAEYGRNTITDSVTAFSITPAYYTLTRRLRDNAALRLRAGVALGNTLVYGTGGVAYGKIRNSFDTSNAVNTFTNTGNDSAYGYRVGGGVEQRIGRSFSIGVQYLYTSLNDDDFRVRVQGPAPVGNPFIKQNPAGTDFARSAERFNSHSAHVTTSFRF